jgi:simple sugar transport system permease protein
VRSGRFLTTVVAPVVAIVIAFSIAGLVLLFADIDPLNAFKEMWKFGTTTDSLISTVNRSLPLYVSALAVAVGFKMGLFNIGVEGAYLLAALIAAWFGALFSVTPIVHIALILIVAMTVGAIWNGIAGLLKVKRGVHEVISTIMLNFIAFSLSAYLFKEYFIPESEGGGLSSATVAIPASGRIPSLNRILGAVGIEAGGIFELHGFLVIAVFLGVGYHYLVNKSRFGFDLRASGVNPAAAHVSGVNPKAMIMKTMLISGALAGLVGMSLLLGEYHQYPQDFRPGLGFTGIGVALLGRNHAVGIAFGAFLFGFLERSALILDFFDVPREIVTIMQGVILFTVVIVYEVISRYVAKRTVEAAARATAEEAGLVSSA